MSDRDQMRQVLRSPIVGRETELAALRTALLEARRGRGGVVLVQGEAGIGKSRLTSEITSAAGADGVTVLSGRASEVARPSPFRPLSEALSARFRGSALPESTDLLPLRSALGCLVPEWRDANLPAIDESLVIVAEGLVRLLRFLGHGAGCLILIEDLHWADPETLAVVEYLADNLVYEPTLCVVTLRAEEATPGRSLAYSLKARRAVVSLDLGRLENTEIVDVARGCLGTATLPEAVVEPLQTWTEGVPFLIEELLRAWVSTGALKQERTGGWSTVTRIEPVVPASFADALERRVDRLGDDTRNVLRAAAVLGRRFEWSLIPLMTGLPRTAVLRVLAQCVSAQIIIDEPGEAQPVFCFQHALTRDAIYGGLLTPERTELSAMALRAVEEAHPTLDGWWCDLAADLAQASGNQTRAAHLLLISGRRALSQGALSSAEAALERARALDPTPSATIEVDATLTEVLALAGKVGPAVEVGARLLATCSAACSSATRQTEFTLRLARALVANGAWELATVQLQNARQLAACLDEPLFGPCADVLSAQTALGQSRHVEAAGLATTALLRAEEANLPDVACAAHEVLGRCARPRDLGEARAAFGRALRIAEDHGLTVWKIRALHELASIEVLTTARLDRPFAARELAYQSGALAVAAGLDLDISTVLAFNFDTQEALVVARRCTDAANRFRLGLLLPLALLRQGQCHAIEGSVAEMESVIAEALAVAHGDSVVSAGAWGQCRATLSLLRNEKQRALDELEQGASFVRKSPESYACTFWPMLALLRTTEDVEGEAARDELRASGGASLPFHQALLSYADAVALGAKGMHQDANDAFAEAEEWIALLAQRGGYGHLALRFVAERALKDGWGDPVAWLRTTVVFFEDNGQGLVASACRSLLSEAGAPLPRRRRSDSQVPSLLRTLGVTARELEVLDLVTQGLPNNEIGSRLYISHRTVDKHVQHLLAKTRLENRSELRRFTAQASLDLNPHR